MGLPLWVPAIYITLLFGPLYLFSKYYMGKKQRKSPPPTLTPYTSL